MNTKRPTRTGDRPTLRGVLWATAALLTAGILLRAGGGSPFERTASADMIGASGDYTAMTTNGGVEELLFLIDGRNETLMVYRVLNGRRWSSWSGRTSGACSRRRARRTSGRPPGRAGRKCRSSRCPSSRRTSPSSSASGSWSRCAARGTTPSSSRRSTTDELETLDQQEEADTLVVRYGRMKMIGEFPYSGDMTPGCGSKLVVRTHRGVEMGEMLTSTCPNSGCGSSVSRKEMLEYIENSGGRQYPFSTDGRVLRVATKEDMDEQARLEQSAHELKMGRGRSRSRWAPDEDRRGRAHPGRRAADVLLHERRPRRLPRAGPRARRPAPRADRHAAGRRPRRGPLVADYEKCGQYCCCKNFLKVLKPISMKSAKVQKATLDPVKISGRCGRLMCCLRYEDETYEDLAKRLPKRKAPRRHARRRRRS
jgi:hypothetical protein